MIALTHRVLAGLHETFTATHRHRLGFVETLMQSVTLRRVLVCLGILLLLQACSDANQPAKPAAPPPAQVTVVTVKPQRITLTRELPGRTNPYLVAEVRPQASGIIKARLFKEGTFVKAGQPLYQLEDSTYRSDAATAKAQLARAQSAAHSARLTARRTADLAAIDAVSRQENENAEAALRQAEAEVAAAQAALERSQVVLGYTRITSPITGRVGKSSVTAGALVNANQPQALATVQQYDPIYVDVTMSSSELLALRREFASGAAERANVPVKILLEDGTPYEHPGKFAFADISVDPTTGSFLLRVIVPNPHVLLLPGMYVRAILGTAVREHALLAPQRGVMRDPKGNATAMLVGPDGTVQTRTLVASRTIGDQWLVEEGLMPGDRVIVEGLQKVKPGMLVQAVEASASQPPVPASKTPADR